MCLSTRNPAVPSFHTVTLAPEMRNSHDLMTTYSQSGRASALNKIADTIDKHVLPVLTSVDGHARWVKHVCEADADISVCGVNITAKRWRELSESLRAVDPDNEAAITNALAQFYHLAHIYGVTVVTTQ